MKKIGIYLAHPAHFHLFKKVIKTLRINNDVFIFYNDKDVLHKLVTKSDFSDIAYRIKTNSDIKSKIGLYTQFIKKIWGAYKLFRKVKPDLVVGTPILIALLGKLLPYKSIIVNEDDFNIIKKTSNLGYPYADHILCPAVCRTTKFDHKSVKYNSYHELAYLHPDHFRPNIDVASKYVDMSSPFFILRLAKLMAHHDNGIKGINNNIAFKLVNILREYGNIYITSERPISDNLEPYRISIDPKDMHHVMSFAKLFIGDSQTMSAESGVLGIPFIRFNDFVGRISYLDELENVYNLGFGIKSNDEIGLFNKVNELMDFKGLKSEFQERRRKMLEDKINFASFLTWFIENYPNSVNFRLKESDT